MAVWPLLAAAALAATPASPIRGPDKLERRGRDDARTDAESSWKTLLDRAFDVSRDPDRLKDALDLYEQAIDELPPFADSLEQLSEFSERFYASLLKRH